MADKATLAWTIPWDDDAVTSVAFLGPHRLAAGNEQGTIYVLDLPEKDGGPAPARRLEGHTNVVTALAALPDGKTLLSASYDHTLRAWDVSAPAKDSAEAVLDRKAREAAAKKGKPVAAPGVKVAVQKDARVLDAHREWIRTLSVGAGGKQVLSGDDKGVAVLWDAAAMKEVKRLQVTGWLRAVALSPDGRLALTCEFTPRYAQFPNAIKIWDVAAGTVKIDLAKDFKRGNSVTGICAGAFSPDGKYLVLGEGGERDGNAKVFLLEAETGRKLQELGGHQYGVTTVAFTPDGKFLATGGRDTQIRLWGVPDGKMVQELGKARGGQFKDWIHAVAVSADGKRLAGADMAGQIHVWSLA
jgi:WD40 repeat protein